MKKIGLISMVLVLAMGMLGVGSAWADTVVAGETDTVVGIRNVSTDDPSGSLDPVWNGEEIVTSENDVASCISTNGDPKCLLNGETQFYDSVTETISNAYPGYAPTMTFEVANCGSDTVWVTDLSQEITESYEGLFDNFVWLYEWSVQTNDGPTDKGTGEDHLMEYLAEYEIGSGDVVTLTLNLIILEKNPWNDKEELPQGETATLQDTFTYTAFDENWNPIGTDTTMFTIDLVTLVKNPPGWNKGKKSGWDGSVPPGLEKKDKTPNGFDKGKKAGWK
jgi:hypothetical protein